MSSGGRAANDASQRSASGLELLGGDARCSNLICHWLTGDDASGLQTMVSGVLSMVLRLMNATNALGKAFVGLSMSALLPANGSRSSLAWRLGSSTSVRICLPPESRSLAPFVEGGAGVVDWTKHSRFVGARTCRPCSSMKSVAGVGASPGSRPAVKTYGGPVLSEGASCQSMALGYVLRSSPHRQRCWLAECEMEVGARSAGRSKGGARSVHEGRMQAHAIWNAMTRPVYWRDCNEA